MAKVKNPAERWLWYACKTRVCVPLDAAAYPTTLCGGEIAPFPSWACQGPNGGIHIDRRVGGIDVEVAMAPTSRIELNWTCTYGVRVVSKAWLDDIRDLIDESKIGIGEVRRRGRPLTNWATLNEAAAPAMFGTDGWAQQCPICGDVLAMVAGRQFFIDPTVVGRPLVVNNHGIFVREDLALARNLRIPTGAFKPSMVKFLANPPPISAAPTWASSAARQSSSDKTSPSSAGWKRLVSAVRKLLHR